MQGHSVLINEPQYTQAAIHALQQMSLRQNKRPLSMSAWSQQTAAQLTTQIWQTFCQTHQERGASTPSRIIRLHHIPPQRRWVWLSEADWGTADIHVFIQFAMPPHHLMGFLAHLDVFKDKVLKRGEEVGALTAAESSSLFDRLPTFQPIPAYICGFVSQHIPYQPLPYTGKHGRLNYTITGWNGPIAPTDLEQIRTREGVRGKIAFEGIGTFSHDKGYLFNTGNLLWREEDWAEQLFQKL